MRLGLTHRFSMDACAVLAFLALLSAGRIASEVALGLAVAILLAASLPESQRRNLAERRADLAAALVVIIAQAARAWSGDAIERMIELIAALLIIRVAIRKGARHDHQVIVLGLVAVVAAIALGGGAGVLLCLIALAAVVPAALVMSQLRREVEGNSAQGARDRSGSPVDVPRILRSKRVVGTPFLAALSFLGAPVALVAISVYALAPRLAEPWVTVPGARAALRVAAPFDLASLDATNDAVVVRLTPTSPHPPAPQLAMHLRAAAFDRWNGRTWSQSESARSDLGAADVIVVAEVPEPAREPSWHVDLLPTDPPVLLLPEGAAAFRLRSEGLRAARAADDAVLLRGPRPQHVRYDVFLGAPAMPPQYLERGDRRRYLELPHDLPDRVAALAQTWTADIDDPEERARAIERHLRADFVYDRATPSAGTTEPLDDFLFSWRRGHCTYFATAMAVLLRELGIPSRAVSGFAGGTWNRFGGYYAVRADQAHAWVEAHIDGRGWVSFDPTPSAPTSPPSVLSDARDLYDAADLRWMSRLDDGRASFADRLLIALAALVALALAGVLAARLGAARRVARANPSPSARGPMVAASVYALLDRAMTSVGVPRAAAVPPLRHALAVESSGHPAAAEIRALTERYLEARFGRAPFTPADHAAFVARVRRLGSR